LKKAKNHTEVTAMSTTTTKVRHERKKWLLLMF